MSSNNPFDPAGEPEFLSQGPPEPAPVERSGRTRVAVLAGVGVVAAGAVGVGAWGVAQLLGGGGPGAASVIPDTALLYAAVDLDPSASQKVEAIKTLKKFPAIDEELGIDAGDDIRRKLIDTLADEGTCTGLDYDKDIEPWLGDKAGLAVLPGDTASSPDLVIALQVKDEAKAEDGIATFFEECAEGDEFGIAFLDDYALVSPTKKMAEGARAAAADGVLADDPDYTRLLDDVGQQGVVTAYVAPEGPQVLTEAFMGQMMGGTPEFCTDVPDDLDEASLRQLEEMCAQFQGGPEAQEKLDEALKDFQGAAATIRFDGGGLEFAVAGEGVPSMGTETTSITDLPTSTIAAVAFSLPDGWTETLEAQLKSSFGEGTYTQMLSEAEAATGLQLPEDLEKAFGTDTLLALDGSTDFRELPGSEDPSALKAGLRMTSDEGDVRRIAEALLRAAGAPPGTDFVKIRAAEDQVAVGFDEEYLDELLAGGDLGSEDRFQEAVAEADKARFAVFVDFDAADGWLVDLVDAITDGDEEALRNAEPLDAFGLSGWVEGSTTHVVLRLSTD